MTTNLITQTFIPGFRLIDGSDLNNMVAQMNAALSNGGAGYPLFTALNTVGAGTITAAGIVGGVTTRGGAQAGAAFTDTTDTAAAIVTALGPSIQPGTRWIWVYQNTTNAQATLAGGTGVTISGNLIVPELTWATYVVDKVSATAVSITYLDSGQLNNLPFAGMNTFVNTTSPTINITGLVSAQIATITIAGGSAKLLGIGPAADMFNSMPNARAGQTIEVILRNQGGVTVTLSGLTGVTLGGTAGVDIQNNTAKVCILSLDGPGSATLTGLTTPQSLINAAPPQKGYENDWFSYLWPNPRRHVLWPGTAPD